MNDAVIPELELLIFSVASGIICFFGYDLLLVLRIFSRRSLILEKLEDILYWLAASVFVFSVIYEKNSGVIRAYSIAGMLAGMLLYRAAVRGRLTRAAQRKSDCIRKWFNGKMEPLRKKRLELKNKRKQGKIEKEELKKKRKQERKEEKEKQKREQEQNGKEEKQKGKQEQNRKEEKEKQNRKQEPKGRQEKEKQKSEQEPKGRQEKDKRKKKG